MDVGSGVDGQGDGQRCSSGEPEEGKNSSELSEVNETGFTPS